MPSDMNESQTIDDFYNKIAELAHWTASLFAHLHEETAADSLDSEKVIEALYLEFCHSLLVKSGMTLVYEVTDDVLTQAEFSAEKIRIINKLSQFFMIFLGHSIEAGMAAFVVNSISYELLGFSKRNSQLLGTMTRVCVKTAMDFTPYGLAKTATQLGAGYIGGKVTSWMHDSILDYTAPVSFKRRQKSPASRYRFWQALKKQLSSDEDFLYVDKSDIGNNYAEVESESQRATMAMTHYV